MQDYALSKNGFLQTANAITQKIGRKMSGEEIKKLRHLIENMPPAQFIGKSHLTVVHHIAHIFIKSGMDKTFIDDWRQEYDVTEIHDYQRKEVQSMAPAENQLKFTTFSDRMGKALPQRDGKADPISGLMPRVDEIIQGNIEPPPGFLESLVLKSAYRTNQLLQGFLGAENLTEVLKREKNSLINYDSVILPRRIISFNSRNRSQSTDYFWELVPFPTGGNSRGQIILGDTLQQIVRISCNSIRFPIPATNPNIVFYKKIKMLIIEFTGQGTIISTNEDLSTKVFYTFEFDSIRDGNYLNLTPTEPWTPNKVINQCSSISVRFYAQEQIIPDADRLTCVISNTNPAVITAPQPHYLITGDLVYFSSSGNTLLDQMSGYYIAVLSATTFSINFDLSHSPAAITSSVFFASKSIDFQLSFISLER